MWRIEGLRAARSSVAEIFEIRLLVESVAARRLAERQEASAEMERHVRALEALPAAPSAEEWAAAVDHDQGFHAALVQTLDNRRLVRMYGLVQAENRLCLAQERHAYADLGEVAREHRRLLDAFTSESPARVVELLTVHLEDARGRLVALADRAPEGGD
jgi:DNA-binding GntR family transcriptional regulator